MTSGLARPRSRAVAALLGAALATMPAVPAAAAGADGAPDRHAVPLPPVYPAPPAGFLRLPDTRTEPVRVPPTDPTAWTPSRLEPVVGIDARGRIRSILEYTPGRFAR